MILDWLYYSNGLFVCTLAALWLSHTVVVLLKRPKSLFCTTQGSILSN